MSREILRTLVGLIDRANVSMPECWWMNADERSHLDAARALCGEPALVYCWQCGYEDRAVVCPKCGSTMEVTER